MKPLLRVLAVFIVILAAAFTFLVFHVGTLVKSFAENQGSELLGAKIRVEAVSVGLLSGRVKIKALRIGPPADEYKNDLFFVNEIIVGCSMKSILSDKIVITDISIRGPEITYEIAGGNSNVSTLLARFEKDKPEKKKKTETGVIIKRFTISDCKVKIAAAFLGGRGVSVVIPEIGLTGIGERSGGATAYEATSEIVKCIGGGIINSIGQVGLEAAELGKDVLINAAGAAINTGSAAADAAAGAGAAALSGVEAIGGAAVSGVKTAGKVIDSGFGVIRGLVTGDDSSVRKTNAEPAGASAPE